MGIIISKIDNNEDHTGKKGVCMDPPVEGAIRLTALEMNGLHFGSDKTTPFTSVNKT